jgi:GAF domain-containing protein
MFRIIYRWCLIAESRIIGDLKKARFMEHPPIPPDEKERLAALYKLNLLDTPAEERFDRITKMICRVMDVPMAVFTLVDNDRQWFKSRQGIDSPETSKEISFCAHTIVDTDMLMIPDAKKDKRFSENPFVTGDPHIVFYLGCPVHSPDGFKIGSLCAIDNRTHELSLFQLQFMRDMAKLIEMEIIPHD